MAWILANDILDRLNDKDWLKSSFRGNNITKIVWDTDKVITAQTNTAYFKEILENLRDDQLQVLAISTSNEKYPVLYSSLENISAESSRKKAKEINGFYYHTNENSEITIIKICTVMMIASIQIGEFKGYDLDSVVIEFANEFDGCQAGPIPINFPEKLIKKSVDKNLKTNDIASLTQNIASSQMEIKSPQLEEKQNTESKIRVFFPTSLNTHDGYEYQLFKEDKKSKKNDSVLSSQFVLYRQQEGKGYFNNYSGREKVCAASVSINDRIMEGIRGGYTSFFISDGYFYFLKEIEYKSVICRLKIGGKKIENITELEKIETILGGENYKDGWIHIIRMFLCNKRIFLEASFKNKTTGKFTNKCLIFDLEGEYINKLYSFKSDDEYRIEYIDNNNVTVFRRIDGEISVFATDDEIMEGLPGESSFVVKRDKKACFIGSLIDITMIEKRVSDWSKYIAYENNKDKYWKYKVEHKFVTIISKILYIDFDNKFYFALVNFPEIHKSGEVAKISFDGKTIQSMPLKYWNSNHPTLNNPNFRVVETKSAPPMPKPTIIPSPLSPYKKDMLYSRYLRNNENGYKYFFEKDTEGKLKLYYMMPDSINPIKIHEIIDYQPKILSVYKGFLYFDSGSSIYRLKNGQVTEVISFNKLERSLDRYVRRGGMTVDDFYCFRDRIYLAISVDNCEDHGSCYLSASEIVEDGQRNFEKILEFDLQGNFIKEVEANYGFNKHVYSTVYQEDYLCITTKEVSLVDGRKFPVEQFFNTKILRESLEKYIKHIDTNYKYTNEMYMLLINILKVDVPNRIYYSVLKIENLKLEYVLQIGFNGVIYKSMPLNQWK